MDQSVRYDLSVVYLDLTENDHTFESIESTFELEVHPLESDDGERTVDRWNDCDCLVIDPTADIELAQSIIADITETGDHPPIIYYTFDDPESLSKEILDEAVTIIAHSENYPSEEILEKKLHALIRIQDDPTVSNPPSFRPLVEVARDGIYVLDGLGRIQYLNDSMASMFGYPAEELLGSNIVTLQAPGELERGQGILREIIDTHDSKSQLMDMVWVRKNGDRFIGSSHFTLRDPEAEDYSGIIGVMRDVTDQREQEIKYRERSQQLDVLDRVLRHNLRTEINTINGYAEMIIEEGDGEIVEYAQSILDAGSDLHQVANKHREIARHLADDPAVSMEPLSAVLDRCVDRAQSANPNAQILLRSDDDLEVEVIPQLEAIVNEIVSNAIEHNDQIQTRIDIEASLNSESIDITVGDNGPGIPLDEQRIIEEDIEINALYHKSGMGLWLVKWLLNRFGGSVTFEPNDPRGTLVRIRLPRQVADASNVPVQFPVR